MVKVKCIKPYFDKSLNKTITIEDEPFEVKEERAKKLIEAKVCEIVETIEKPIEDMKEEIIKEIDEQIKQIKRKTNKSRRKK